MVYCTQVHNWALPHYVRLATSSHDKCSEAFFFTAIPLLYVTLNANHRTTTKKMKGTRNEAKHLVVLQHMCRGCVVKVIPGVGLLPVTVQVPVLIATQISGVEAAKKTANI